MQREDMMNYILFTDKHVRELRLEINMKRNTA